LNRVHWAYSDGFFRLGGGRFLEQLPAGHGTPILRQQLKWITRGTILAITPFTLFYVLPYLLRHDAFNHHEGVTCCRWGCFR
jgi:two-component system, NtrC family, sensor kinase